MVSDGCDLSTPALIKYIAKYMDVPLLMVPVPEVVLRIVGKLLGKSAVTDRLCNSLQVDISKTGKLLEWEPPFSVDDGIKKTVEWYLKYRNVSNCGS